MKCEYKSVSIFSNERHENAIALSSVYVHFISLLQNVNDKLRTVVSAQPTSPKWNTGWHESLLTDFCKTIASVFA